MDTRWMRLLGALLALALVGAACGDDEDADVDVGEAVDEVTEGAEDVAGEVDDAVDGDTETDTEADSSATAGGSGDLGAMDFSGETITILGPETGEEAEGFEAGLAPFEEATGATVEYNASRDATTELNLAIEAGTPPDVAVIPQPGRIQSFGASGDAVAIPQETVNAVAENFNPFWLELATVDGQVYGMPNKADVKSLVWYNPQVFDENGYEVPETWDELEALSEQMKGDDIAPWCVGLVSGDATGWPFTDWMEDVMLRLHGPEVYDQWVSHEIPFDDPRVAEVAEFVTDIWFEDGNVLGGRDVIASTGFQEAGLGVLSGDCGMHRQANFYAAQFVDAGATIGTDVDIFYLPTITDEFGQVVLGAGTHLVPFSEEPAVMALIEYIGTPEYANARIESDRGGFLSPNTAHDTSLYSSDLDRDLAEILVNADPFRFDASDLMPGEVGAGEWWRSGTDYVSGAIDLETFLSNTENAWP